MSIRLLVAAIAAVGLFLFATSTWATGWHKPPVFKPPVVKPPIVVPPVVSPPVVTPTPPVVAAPPTTPAAPATQPAPAQQASGASKGSALAGQIAFAGVGAFMWAAVCSKEKHRGVDNWFTRYFCLDVKLKERPTPEHMLPTFANP